MARSKNIYADAPDFEEAIAGQLASTLAPRQTAIQDIPIDRIEPNPFQARKTFDREGIGELADAIRAQGFTSRLRVRPHPGRPGFFQLVYGERRVRAAQVAGLITVPCEIADHADDDLLEIGLAENIQRRDLAPLEEAHAFKAFIEQRGYSIRRLAERIGKDKGYIENRLALLHVPEDVQHLVEQRPDTVAAARQLAKLESPEERQPLIDGLVEGTITLRDVRNKVREHQAPQAPGAAARDRDDAGLEHDLQSIKAILSRWRQLHADHETQPAVVDYLRRLIAEVESLRQEWDVEL